MHFEKIIEITRIKQEIKEIEESYKSYLPEKITEPIDAIKFVQALIGDEDCTPLELIENLDSDSFQLAMNAVYLRKYDLK